MKKWIIPSNLKQYDVFGAFDANEEIDWTQKSAKIGIGDMVFIYVGLPVSAIKYCCLVMATDVDDADTIGDGEFVRKGDYKADDSKYMRLRKLSEFDDELPVSILQERGVNGNLQGRRTVPAELDKYMTDNDLIPDDALIRVFEMLNSAEEIIPDEYDGSYELMRETVRAYSNLKDFSQINYRDLNLVYHMSIGTWSHGIDRKKESVEESHLNKQDKDRLIAVLNKVWERAANHEYENNDGDADYSVGMFGTGIYNLETKTNDQASQAFIKMCVDILDMDDDEQVYDRVETVFYGGFKGMRAPAASMVLHCLKPYTFPIMNSNMGHENIYVALGVDLVKKISIETYIENCRSIKEYRDKYYSFKNYRVFDIAAWELERKSDMETGIDCIGLLDYLMENGGKPYKSPSKATEKELPAIQETKKKGQNAISTLKKIGEACSDEHGPFEIDGGKWLDASYTKVRDYLWAQLKYSEFNDSPESISIFVEKDEDTGDPRFRVSLEIKDYAAEKEDYARHYRSLDLPLEVEQGFQYFLGGNNSDIEYGASDETDPAIIRKKLDDKEISKVQISRCIGRDDVSSNEEMLQKIVDAVGVAKGYYNYVMGIEGSENESEYWPPLDEYDPELSKEEYKDCISDSSAVKFDNLDTVYRIYQMGGEASCKQIAAKYGNTAAHYNQNGTHVGRWSSEHTGCSIREDDQGKHYWTVLFVGRKTTAAEEGDWIWRLREPLKEAVAELDREGFFGEMEVENVMEDRFDKNMILYGPPGTGKTYNSINYAVAICEGRSLREVQAEDYAEVLRRYNELRNDGRVAFTTFHQSYGYEEFIEGIKPVMGEDDEASDEGKDIQYTIKDGAFKEFCDRAAQVEVTSSSFGIRPKAKIYKITIADGEMNDIKDECFKEGNMRIGFDLNEDEKDNSVKIFKYDMEPGDIVISFKTRKTIDGIGVIGEGAPSNLPDKDIFKAYRPVKWIATDIDENILDINDGKMLHRMTVSGVPRMAVEDILDVAEKYNATLTETKIEKNTKPYVFIIDEINRGNISKIFGELITLIETTKRKGEKEALSATLPYSQSSFSVPANVYILGTMNTADRSIALMDTALRRRFNFVEMMPDTGVLERFGADQIKVNGKSLDVVAMLNKINARIEYLFDREHMIGHSFFMGLTEDPTIERLAEIFEKNVIPLLQEYFYEDYRKIQLILGDDNKEDDRYKFIRDSQVVLKELFNSDPDLDLGETKYEINQAAFKRIESYLQI